MQTLTSLISQRELILSAEPSCPWANQMVLNPGAIRDPETGRLHMLFRATGNGQSGGQPSDSAWPYPIYLGYAFSDDDGAHWEADFSEPAMKPALGATPESLAMKDAWGFDTLNYANGCIEDPRLFMFEGRCHLIVACRVFPPGAYWLNDDPMQCAPRWAQDYDHTLGRAVGDNITVNLLYEVSLDSLTRGQYASAFKYITHLTNPAWGENRDVLLFSKKLQINGKSKIVCLHRPWESEHYPQGSPEMPPSIWYAVSDSLDQLNCSEAEHELLASPIFEWENNRIGASAPPLEVEPGVWLVSYHGKQNNEVGYTQSFMLVEETGYSNPIITHRCPQRLLIPAEPWEQPGAFTTPCLFVTSILRVGDDELLVVYGAADERVGMVTMSLSKLLEVVRQYNSIGQ